MKIKVIIGACLVLLGGCAAQIMRTPVPAALVDAARIQDLPNVRYWGDDVPPNIDQEIALAYQQTLSQRPHLFKKGRRQAVSFLAISGGGSDGAFGAGVLSGWSDAGTRPEFDLVTGVSTGALAAPFVFLGSKYNRQLKEIYTKYSTNDLLDTQVLAGLLGGSAITDSTKLANVIANYVDYDLLRAVAREHKRGRRLLVGTTNLDAERPVVWNMGQIAQRNNKKALALFRKVLLASAAIPGVFPPVVIDVDVNGETLQELHVDGGTTGQVFFLPPKLLIQSISGTKRGQLPKSRDLYAVMNTPLDPRFQTVTASAQKIAGRSLYTLMKQQAISDLYKLYVEAKRNKIAYHHAAIPPTFTRLPKEAFDKDYMNALFDVGYALGRNGYPWSTKPPGL